LQFFNPIDNNKTKFHYNQNHFTFDYAGIWFQSSENLLYRYKLENYDYDWSLPTHTRSVTYSNLPPGNYVLKLRYRISWDDGSIAMMQYLAFEISPPFYKTGGLYQLQSLAFCCWFFIILNRGLPKLLKAKEELELEVQKRTKTIMQQKKNLKPSEMK